MAGLLPFYASVITESKSLLPHLNQNDLLTGKYATSSPLWLKADLFPLIAITKNPVVQLFSEISAVWQDICLLKTEEAQIPKGHVEDGETLKQTAKREVLEETGIHLEIFPGFMSKSQYTIQNKIQKTVHIFAGTTKDEQTKIQQEEIEDYIWLPFDGAYKYLKFENDKSILKEANEFLIQNKYISEV